MDLNSNLKIDRSEIEKFKVRSTMQTLLGDKHHEVQKIKEHYSAIIDVIPVTNQSFCVLITFGNITYCINPLAGLHEVLLSIGKVPLMNSVFFTQFDRKTALSLIPFLLSHQQLNVTTLDLFGPQGMRGIFASVMPLISSVKAWEMWQTRLLFHETSYPGVVTINKKNFGDVKIISFHSCNATRVLGYIFQSHQVKGLPQIQSIKSAKISWQSFPSLPSYITYLKQCLGSCENAAFSCVDATALGVSNISLCVLDCCDEKLLEEILLDRNLLNLLSNVSVCIHLASKSFFYSNSYSRLKRKLFSCQHVSVHNLSPYNRVPNKLQCFRALLHAVHPSFFPLYSNKHCLESLQKQLVSGCEFKHSSMVSVIPHKVYLKYNFSTKNVEKVERHLQNISKLSHFKQFSSHNLFPHVVVLGSGSSNISHCRTSPCYFLRISHNSSIMIDCGPSSLSQAIKHYGVGPSKSVFASLQSVVLTHKHSDHWCGFIDFLKMLNHCKRSDNLFVFLPKQMKRFFLHNYDHKIFQNTLFITFEDFVKSTVVGKHQLVAKRLQLKSLKFVRVSHGPPTYGVVIELLDGRKVVYSSDTLPLCQNLVESGTNANLLIHDCLYINEADEEMATFRMHSTFSGAVATARQMNAKSLLLTHFCTSSRFLPLDTRKIKLDYDGNILVAFDHLELPLSKVDEYVDFLDTLSYTYEEDYEKCNVVYESHKTNELMNIYKQVKSAACM